MDWFDKLRMKRVHHALLNRFYISWTQVPSGDVLL